MNGNGKKIQLIYNVLANEKCANVDYKYGPYKTTSEAFSALKALDCLTVGLTVGIIGSDGRIKEYWFEKACASASDLVIKVAEIGTVNNPTNVEFDDTDGNELFSIDAATTSLAGVMSAADKTKLNDTYTKEETDSAISTAIGDTPLITASKSGTTTTITIKDKSGTTQTTTIEDGAQGNSGVASADGVENVHDFTEDIPDDTTEKVYTAGAKEVKSLMGEVDEISENFNFTTVASKNLLDMSAITEGQYLDKETGEPTGSETSYFTTDFIPVTAGQYYTCGYDGYQSGSTMVTICFYNSDKAYIADSYKSYTSTVQAPEGASYMRVTPYYGKDKYQIEVGQSMTSYEEYYVKTVSSLKGENIVDASVSEAKLAEDIQQELGKISDVSRIVKGLVTEKTLTYSAVTETQTFSIDIAKGEKFKFKYSTDIEGGEVYLWHGEDWSETGRDFEKSVAADTEYEIEATADFTYLNIYVIRATSLNTGTLSFTLTQASELITEEDVNNIIYDTLLEERAAGGNLLNMNDADYKENTFLSSTTGKADNTNNTMDTTGYIAVSPSTKYTHSGFVDGTYHQYNVIRFVAFYDSSKTFLAGTFIDTSGAQTASSNVFTTPETAAYARLTVYNINMVTPTASDTSRGAANQHMLVEGSAPATEYVEYSTSTKIKASLIDIDNSAVQIHTDGATYRGDIASGATVSLGIKNSVKTRKVIAFSATIGTWDSSSKLYIGHGNGSYASSWIEIDSANVNVIEYYTSRSVVKTVAHGLTIKNNIQVKIIVDTNNTCNVYLCSNGTAVDGFYSLYDGCNGDIWAKAEGCAFTGAVLGWYADSLKYDNWIFGDSYIAIVGEARWSSYLITDGHKKNMLNSYGGEGSAEALSELQKLLKMGTPKRIVWCLGMNDGDSTISEASATPNSNWQSAVESVMSICKEKDIELVLATIPTVIGGYTADSGQSDSRYHKAKNDYVKASGYRYIDFAKAVGASDSTGLWYNNGEDNDMLEDIVNGTQHTRVHPTAYGARALYHEAIADCPELCTFE